MTEQRFRPSPPQQSTNFEDSPLERQGDYCPTPPPSSVVVNTLGHESGVFWFESCSGVWYPMRRPCGVAINTLVDSINWLGKPQV